MPVARGFRSGTMLAVAAADLLGSRAQRDDDQPVSAEAFLFEAGDLKLGDAVIHEDHGLAIVAGLEALPEGDAIVLRFAGDNRRLVPVAEADRLCATARTRTRSRSTNWTGRAGAKRRGDIDAAIAESARQLSDLAAERATKTAPVLDPDPAAYERIAARFAFTETADQARAISAVRDDLASGSRWTG
jgi:transcription-repair coupling factor (superfamily II helicase)